MATRKAIDEICQDSPGEYFVYLRHGWKVDGQGNGISECHSFGADSQKEITSILKEQVVLCNCSDCQ